MLERIKTLHIQNVLALIILITCSVIVLTVKDKQLQEKYFDMGLVGVIGWSFTQSKQRQDNSNPPPQNP